mmetsp:Transcript_2975/g.6360  ORF Transcript_2975/g.6360 Transcript_2975/m.6360 type:complete len:606 (-) Transcript_2975:414-2231(-)
MKMNIITQDDRSGFLCRPQQMCKRSRLSRTPVQRRDDLCGADNDGQPRISEPILPSCCFSSRSNDHDLPIPFHAKTSSASRIPHSSRGRSGNFGRRIMFASATAALFLCTTSSILTPASASRNAAFVTAPTFPHHPLRSSRQSMSYSRKNPNHGRVINTSNGVDTWSNPVRKKTDMELNESRFGVRNRVKRVLDKAKKRTGIENGSEGGKKYDTKNGASPSPSSFTRTGADIVADTASLGGWDLDNVDLISRGKSTPDSVSDESSIASDDSGNEIVVAEDNLNSEETHKENTTLSKFVSESKNDVSNGGKVMVSTATISESFSFESDGELPEDNLVNASTSETSNKQATGGDSGTAKSTLSQSQSQSEPPIPPSAPPIKPLPFTLPTLTPDQHKQVMRGDRVQYQDDMGRAGSGFVVWDVRAPSSVVWDCLLDFPSYPQTIPTVREVIMYTDTRLTKLNGDDDYENYLKEKPREFEDGTVAICKHGIPSVTRAQFSLSKFRLKIAAIHKYRPHPKGDYMIFTLDPASTNMALKYAKGIWHTESNPDGKEGYTRVWLLCELRVSRLLPQWIVDYAAARAMPRATTWLKPQVETAATLWLRDSAERK